MNFVEVVPKGQSGLEVRLSLSVVGGLAISPAGEWRELKEDNTKIR